MIHSNIEIVLGDITKISVDAIVNAANTSLLGGGGVDGAIHKAGGKALTEECEKIRNKQGGCKVGSAVITTAGNLPAKYVIHTVGPIIYGKVTNKDCVLLKSSYLSSLKLADEAGLKNIAFCCISTGAFFFPQEEAAKIAIHTVKEYLENTKTDIEVIFDVFGEKDERIYKRLLN